MRRAFLLSVFLAGLSILAASCAPAAAPSKPASDAPAERQAPAGQAPSGGAKPVGSGAPAAGGEKAAAERMIVYESKLSMEVKDTTEAMEEVAAIARRKGGYVVSNSFRLEGDRKVATITIRVPSKAYDETLAELRRLSLKVEQEDSKSQDVTEEYSDLGAQLRNLEATEVRYLDLLKRAESIDDILKVQARISETRREIERIKGRMQYLDRTTEMASITVSLLTRTVEKADPKQGLPTWWRKTTDAFDQSFVFLGNVATLLGMVIGFLWWLIILGAAAALVLNRYSANRPQSPPRDEPK